MKKLSINTKFVYFLAFGIVSTFANSLPVNALPFDLFNYQKYKVKDVNPFGVSDIVILEDTEGQEKWYLAEEKAIDKCKLQPGKTIKAKLAEDSKAFQSLVEKSDISYIQRKFIERADGRVVFAIRGCYKMEAN